MEIKENCVHSWLESMRPIRVFAVAVVVVVVVLLLVIGNVDRTTTQTEAFNYVALLGMSNVRLCWNWRHKVWNYLPPLTVSHCVACTIFLQFLFSIAVPFAQRAHPTRTPADYCLVSIGSRNHERSEERVRNESKRIKHNFRSACNIQTRRTT